MSIQRALQLARMAAGERDVSVAGAASVIQQVLNAGWLDEVQIHLVPILLGAGRRLFGELDMQPKELETVRVAASPGVTHLKFRIPREEEA